MDHLDRVCLRDGSHQLLRRSQDDRITRKRPIAGAVSRWRSTRMVHRFPEMLAQAKDPLVDGCAREGELLQQLAWRGAIEKATVEARLLVGASGHVADDFAFDLVEVMVELLS